VAGPSYRGEVTLADGAGDDFVGDDVVTCHHGLIYTSEEILAALDEPGFRDVEMAGEDHGGAPTGDGEFLDYLARRDDA
jgi:hypothetical protein